MITDLVDIADVLPLERAGAMRLAGAEYDRLLGLVDELTPPDWSKPTDCTSWDVKAVLSHLLVFMKSTPTQPRPHGRQPLRAGRPRADDHEARRPDRAARA